MGVKLKHRTVVTEQQLAELDLPGEVRNWIKRTESPVVYTEQPEGLTREGKLVCFEPQSLSLIPGDAGRVRRFRYNLHQLSEDVMSPQDGWYVDIFTQVDKSSPAYLLFHAYSDVIGGRACLLAILPAFERPELPIRYESVQALRRGLNAKSKSELVELLVDVASRLSYGDDDQYAPEASVAAYSAEVFVESVTYSFRQHSVEL